MPLGFVGVRQYSSHAPPDCIHHNHCPLRVPSRRDYAEMAQRRHARVQNFSTEPNSPSDQALSALRHRRRRRRNPLPGPQTSCPVRQVPRDGAGTYL